MAENRKSYGEGCIAAHALDLIGDRWALLVVRELMLGPRRFGAIKAGLPGIATNILTRRLDDLLAAGVIAREDLTGAPGYRLTGRGLALAPVIRELCRWGAGTPGHDPRLPISPTALMLSMQAMLRPDAQGRHSAGFAMRDELFLVEIDGPRIQTRRTDAPEGPVRLSGPPNAMASAVYGPVPVAELARRGTVALQGDAAAAQAFVDLFHLSAPPPA